MSYRYYDLSDICYGILAIIGTGIVVAMGIAVIVFVIAGTIIGVREMFTPEEPQITVEEGENNGSDI